MLKKYRPITAGTRQLILPINETLTRAKEGSRAKVKPTKSLMLPKKRTNGRNNNGHITCRHKGGGHKRHYRIIDFKRDKENIPARVASIEYDPNRSAYIALLNYSDGEKRYILAPHGLKDGDVVQTSDEPPFSVGCCMKLKFMPLGSTIHAIEMIPGRGAKMVRSAGLSAQLMARSGGYATIRMPSGEVRMVSENCRAAFGMVSNSEHNLRVEGKAGRMRWKGIRPTVRGTAMNPVDHPHGGGEGKHKGNIPQTPWALYTRGLRTRSQKKSNKFIVKDRRKK
ncbi:50S ribosomal protein L2 [Neochlamydia sp. EPS4]|jgi:large subunit ribosomal protein L2|uniref:50S ribosomal protein L2 n=1 Tax=unclassified Neochlamydia TaxID=2643326 RepID=UPI00057E6652|nr:MULTISPECIES: 50S ribosomal protein L2 [unclassified Neochlamydia]KIC72772.1 50S ribosomal protein L2 [Neochlamydia sp. EPS4]KIC76832.1 50S ribosomal protein L2 [Neochlamydia sp. TUME1]MBS4169620.1 50S ribosomal protein L2 [Neochlamydia sp. AcF95]NGY94423.1 50S ribosomal protein L2 [Neochlamydia sp. AcF84]BBI17302.1 50S ribosomal protein L2 [Neochlamydia sp. S13]